MKIRNVYLLFLHKYTLTAILCVTHILKGNDYIIFSTINQKTTFLNKYVRLK